jgi:hypothetical protein
VADGKTFLKMAPGNHSTTGGYWYLATGGDWLMYRVEIQRAGIYSLWVKDYNDRKHPAKSWTRSVRHSARDSSQNLSNVVFESWLWGTGFSQSLGEAGSWNNIAAFKVSGHCRDGMGFPCRLLPLIYG